MNGKVAISSSKPARLNWIDYARGIAIILVAYRHVFEGAKQSGIDVDRYKMLEYANIFFYSFRMPLFFIVSGIFISFSVKKLGAKGYVGGRLRTIMYPYFVWGCLQLLLQMIFAKYSNGQPDPASFLHMFYLPRELAQFWYLYALFSVSMLYLLCRFILKLPLIVNLIIGLGLFYLSSLLYQDVLPASFLMDALHHSFLFDLFHYYIFFVIGDSLGKFLLSPKFKLVASDGRNLLMLLVAFLILQTYFLWANLSHTAAKFMYVEFYQPFVFIIIALVGCSFMAFLTCWMDKRGLMKWLITLGKYSLYIYVAHVIVFAAVRTVMTKVFDVDDALVIIGSGMLFGIIVPVYLYRIADRFNMRWLFTLEKRGPSTENKRLMTEPVTTIQKEKS
ncbi:MAG: acyltransferase [Chitinophagaceae bacterium]|nr:MAG: acyltransferase [Chitinophagaceae bacterium]